MRYRRQFAKIVWLSRPYWQAAIHVIISTLILFFVNFFLVNKEIMRFEWIFFIAGRFDRRIDGFLGGKFGFFAWWRKREFWGTIWVVPGDFSFKIRV
jgi:hypothetical protein